MKNLPRLNELLNKFNFASEHDKAAAVIALLTGTFRYKMNFAPGFVVLGESKAGKSLLAHSLSKIVAKEEIFPFNGGSEKNIDAALLSGKPVIWAENVKNPISFNILITASEISIRKLGTDSVERVSTSRLVIISDAKEKALNNDEFNRRFIPIKLDKPTYSGILEPDFEAIHQEILDYQSSLTPRKVDPYFGPFTEWNRLFRVPMMYSGMADPWQWLKPV